MRTHYIILHNFYNKIDWVLHANLYSGALKPLASMDNLECEKASCIITDNTTNTNIESLSHVIGHDEVTCSPPRSMSNDGTFKLLSVSPLPLLALAALPGGKIMENTIYLFFIVFSLCYFCKKYAIFLNTHHAFFAHSTFVCVFSRRNCKPFWTHSRSGEKLGLTWLACALGPSWQYGKI